MYPNRILNYKGGSVMKKFLLTAALALCLTLGVCAPARAAETNVPDASVFTDMSENDYFFDAVSWAVKSGVTSGSSATTFSPSGICTRAHVVTFLWRAVGSPEMTSANPFSDVPAGSYFEQPVLWAVSEQITNGTSATTFSPEQQCTYAQVLTFLWREDGQHISDEPGPWSMTFQSHWAFQALAWAEENRLIDPETENFNPDAYCPRADVMVYLYRSLTRLSNDDDSFSIAGPVLYEAASHEDYLRAVGELSREYSGKVVTGNADSSYNAARLVVRTTGELPSVNAYRAEQIVKDVDYLYTIQFTSAADAENCANYLRTLEIVTAVTPDAA